MAADPTYPLFPIVAIVCATLQFAVLTTGFIRQSWNSGVAFLCFWLFWELLTLGIDAVIWSDNADVKLYVYCDIGELIKYDHPLVIADSHPVSHLQIFTSMVKPACTLVITRRLYKIASLRSIELPTRKEVNGLLTLVVKVLSTALENHRSCHRVVPRRWIAAVGDQCLVSVVSFCESFV